MKYDKIAADFPEPFFSETPYPQYIVVHEIPPLPGEVLIGYMIYPSAKSCCVPPFERPMNFLGYCSIFTLLILFWPLSCVPCICGYSYNGYQVPVYK